MIIDKKEFPILEFDGTVPAIIEPGTELHKIKIPEHAVICFFNEVIEKINGEENSRFLYNLRSEMGHHPIYELEYSGKKIAYFHPGVGAPLAAALLEEVIALGCRKFIVCGGAGVLKKDIAVGHFIVPVSAIRDEGTSYHYVKPGREIAPSREALEAIFKTLEKNKFDYITGKTWTTDAFYRETPGKIELRRQEGCITAEMEAAAFFAVAQFRKVKLAQILYGGDDISSEQWDSRQFHSRTEVREKLFRLSVEACLSI
ncbi:MAG: nucleoside phosphorylase [Ignavibacteria bacterium]